MARYLFCPLHNSDGMVTVITNIPNDQRLTGWIQTVVPDADVLPLVGTEVDVKLLIERAFHERFLHDAVHVLRETHPEQSAARVFTRGQRITTLVLLLALLAALMIDFWGTAAAIVLLISFLYMLGIGFKFAMSIVGFFNYNRRVTREQALSIADADLPT